MQTIFPILRYNDARAAIRSLGSALGFVEIFSAPQSEPYVRHTQLKLGRNLGYPWAFGRFRPSAGDCDGTRQQTFYKKKD